MLSGFTTQFRKYDLLKAARTPPHFGVVLGPDAVIEMSGDRPHELSTARVRVSSFDFFRAGADVELLYRPPPTAYRGIERRAAEMLGRTPTSTFEQPVEYDLLEANCEHVARYIATGRFESHLVDGALALLGFGLFLRLANK